MNGLVLGVGASFQATFGTKQAKQAAPIETSYAQVLKGMHNLASEQNFSFHSENDLDAIANLKANGYSRVISGFTLNKVPNHPPNISKIGIEALTEAYTSYLKTTYDFESMQANSDEYMSFLWDLVNMGVISEADLSNVTQGKPSAFNSSGQPISWINPMQDFANTSARGWFDKMGLYSKVESEMYRGTDPLLAGFHEDRVGISETIREVLGKLV